MEGSKTMISLPTRNEKNFDIMSRFLLISLPVFVGLFIVVFREIAVWFPIRQMPKGGYTTVVCAFVGALFDIVPFAAIAIIIRRLIRRGAGRVEIYIKFVFMLAPMTALTPYWLFAYSDPLALGFLLYINFTLLVIGLLVGSGIHKLLKDDISKQ